MNINRIPTGIMTIALATSVLFTGAAVTATAGDRDGPRHENEQRNERQYHRNQGNHGDRSYNHERGWNNGHRVIQRGHEPSRHFIHALPGGYRTIRHDNRDYYYHRGVYYNRYDRGYVMVEAPRFYQLPRHSRQVIVNRTVYYVCDNVYYHSCGDYYEICEAPVCEPVVCPPPPPPVVEREVVIIKEPRHEPRNSIRIDAGPVTVELSDGGCRH